MKVKSIVETPDGQFEFNAVLSPEQHNFLLQYAIGDLVRRGLIPFVSAETEEDLAKIAPVAQDQVMQ